MTTLPDDLLQAPSAAHWTALLRWLRSLESADRKAAIAPLCARLTTWPDRLRTGSLEEIDPKAVLAPLVRHLVIERKMRAPAARTVGLRLGDRPCLTLRRCAIVRGVIGLPAEPLAGLRELTLVRAPLGSRWWPQLGAHQGLQGLERLTLRETDLTAPVQQELQPLLRRLRVLRIEDALWTPPAGPGGGLPELEELHLIRCRLPEPDIARLPSLFPRLRRLHFVAPGALVDNVRGWFDGSEAAPTWPRLEQLHIESIPLADDGAEQLVDALQESRLGTLDGLRRLGLVDCGLSDAVADALLELPERIELDLERNHLRDEGRRDLLARGRVHLPFQSLEPRLLALLLHRQPERVRQGQELLEALGGWRMETLLRDLRVTRTGQIDPGPALRGAWCATWLGLWLLLQSPLASTVKHLDLRVMSQQRTLKVRGGIIPQLPTGLERLTALESLDLSGHPFGAVDPALGSLRSLRRLRLANCRLRSIPDSLAQLDQLEELHLSHNQLPSLPAGLGRLPLRALHISMNKGVDLHPLLPQLTALRDLDLRLNQLPRLPPLPAGLDILRISGNPLQALPDDLQQMPRLRVLRASNCQLESLPPWLGRLPLESVELNGNRLTELPPGLGDAKQLLILQLRRNQLSALPAELTRLVQLVELNLNTNQLTALPVGCGAWTKLRQLDLGNNRFTTLPDEARGWTALQRLSLNNNPELSRLPAELRAQVPRISLYRTPLGS